ncbi:MAG: hypothetical protein V7K87_17980 [Nostoc sp.]
MSSSLSCKFGKTLEEIVSPKRYCCCWQTALTNVKGWLFGITDKHHDAFVQHENPTIIVSKQGL